MRLMGSLAHVMIVAGTSRQWDQVDENQWHARAEAFGSGVATAGGSWVTLRAYEGDDGATADRSRRELVVADGHCTVIIGPARGAGSRRAGSATKSRSPACSWSRTTSNRTGS